MKDKYLSRVLFWIMSMAPVIVLLLINKLYGPYWFVSFLLIYAFIYAPIICIFRLLQLKAIEEKDAWKFFIPFYKSKYYYILWFG